MLIAHTFAAGGDPDASEAEVFRSEARLKELNEKVLMLQVFPCSQLVIVMPTFLALPCPWLPCQGVLLPGRAQKPGAPIYPWKVQPFMLQRKNSILEQLLPRHAPGACSPTEIGAPMQYMSPLASRVPRP